MRGNGDLKSVKFHAPPGGRVRNWLKWLNSIFNVNLLSCTECRLNKIWSETFDTYNPQNSIA